MPPVTVSRLGLRLTPQGHLVSEETEDSPDLEDKIAARLVEAFAQGSGHGLMWLGAGEVGQALPPVFGWWHDFAARYVGGDELAFRICVTNIRAKKLIEKADSFHVSFGVKVSWDARRIANTRTSDATIVYIAR